MTALIAATTAEAISDSFSAATACSFVTAVQKVENPSSSDLSTTAASGISTIRLR